MALFECSYYSGVLARNTDFFVAIPEERPEKPLRNAEGKFRTLFVLHGGLEVPLQRAIRARCIKKSGENTMCILSAFLVQIAHCRIHTSLLLKTQYPEIIVYCH